MLTCLFVHPGAELFGSDRMLLESVRGAVRAGIVSVVALPEGGPLVEQLRAAGARVVIVPMLVLRKALLRPSRWPRLLRDNVRGLRSAWRLLSSVDPDVVYTSTVTVPHWPIVARLRRIPALSHVHEAERSTSRLVNTLLYLPHVSSDAILFNSQFSFDTPAGILPALARRGQIVYNGVAGPKEPPQPRQVIDGPLRILYVGRLSPRKGPDVLLRAAATLIERGVAVEVSLLGSAYVGYEWYFAQLEELARLAPLPGHVQFLDFDPDIWHVVADADVLVVPSRVDEPFGNTAVEGLLALRPVIASDTSGLREAAAGYLTTWLVPPDDPLALADRLRSVIDQWPAIIEDVRASRVRAYQRHSVAVYQEAIASQIIAVASGSRRIRHRGRLGRSS